tara:strand:- start:376 stop:561 length:186 start_codon:yes stop_codon:yes gene_type:complete
MFEFGFMFSISIIFFQMSIERAREPKDLKFVIVCHKLGSAPLNLNCESRWRGGCKNATPLL